MRKCKIALVVFVRFLRSFHYESRVPQFRIVYDPAQSLQPDAALPYMLMPVNMRIEGRKAIVEMDYLDTIQAEQFIEAFQSRFQASLAFYIVSRRECMRRIETNTDTGRVFLVFYL